METLQVESQKRATPVFQTGGYYPIGDSAEAYTRALPAFPEAVRAGSDGGLLSHLTVRRNLLLPLEYHGRDTAHAEEDAAMLLVLCGEEAANLDRLMDCYPDALSLYERRLVGFVRALLVEPETLVMEDIFEGISADDKVRAMRWPEVFCLRFPFREMKYRKDVGMGSADSAGSA